MELKSFTVVERLLNNIFEDVDQECSLNLLGNLCLEDRSHAIESVRKGFLNWAIRKFVDLIKSHDPLNVDIKTVYLSLQVLNCASNHNDFVKQAFEISQNTDMEHEEISMSNRIPAELLIRPTEKISIELLCSLSLFKSAILAEFAIVLLLRVIKTFPTISEGIFF